LDFTKFVRTNIGAAVPTNDGVSAIRAQQGIGGSTAERAAIVLPRRRHRKSKAFDMTCLNFTELLDTIRNQSIMITSRHETPTIRMDDLRVIE
jgi:hypothetical protein